MVPRNERQERTICCSLENDAGEALPQAVNPKGPPAAVPGEASAQPFPVQVRTTPPESVLPSANTALPRALRWPSGQVAERIPLFSVKLKDLTEPLPPAIFGIEATEPRP